MTNEEKFNELKPKLRELGWVIGYDAKQNRYSLVKVPLGPNWGNYFHYFPVGDRVEYRSKKNTGSIISVENGLEYIKNKISEYEKQNN